MFMHAICILVKNAWFKDAGGRYGRGGGEAGAAASGRDWEAGSTCVVRAAGATLTQDASRQQHHLPLTYTLLLYLISPTTIFSRQEIEEHVLCGGGREASPGARGG